MSDYKLTWVTETLAVGHAPMSFSDLEAIRGQGIDAIINLCAEFCDLHEIQEKSGFEVYYFPIEDECAPDEAKMEKALGWLDDALCQGKKVLVHCRFGIGRTGTFVTAFLLRQGFDMKAASRKLKGSLAGPSTYRQWRFLRKFRNKTCNP